MTSHSPVPSGDKTRVSGWYPTLGLYPGADCPHFTRGAVFVARKNERVRYETVTPPLLTLSEPSNAGAVVLNENGSAVGIVNGGRGVG